MSKKLSDKHLNTYVSLDIETTGLNNRNDEIIELGAVKFNELTTLDTFQSLVNPYKELPKFIKDLTGITQSDVNSAPPFSVLASELESFVGTYPIVGQNVGFDLGFLSSKGLNFSNPYYDTRDIAYILLPYLKDYSLNSLLKHLDIKNINPHRALQDAKATALVFLALKTLASNVDGNMLSQMGSVYSKSDGHLGDLFPISNTRINKQKPLLKTFLPSKLTINSPDTTPANEKDNVLNLNENLVRKFFDEDGPLSSAIENYFYRPQQVDMALSVTDAMKNSKNLIVEGGTGVGKSMAYLLPAMLFALENETRVVVSTSTINLQEQLINKDLPALEKGMRVLSPDAGNFSFSSLKGRDNYLCLKKWGSILHEETFAKDEARLISKIMMWLNKTTSGDRSEINISFRDRPIWSRLSASGSSICPAYSEEMCFLRTARRNAENANVLVVNHALLMRDIIEGGGIIPNYDHLIIDEAHNIEDEATNQFGYNLSISHIDDYIDKMNGQRGLYTKISVAISQPEISSRKDSLTKLIQEGQSALSKLIDSNANLWKQLYKFSENQSSIAEPRQIVFKVGESTRTQPDWSQIEICWENVDMIMSRIQNNINKLLISLENIGDDSKKLNEVLLSDINSSQETLNEIKKNLSGFIIHPQIENIYWVSIGPNDQEISLNVAPIHVGNILNGNLFSQKKSVIITSATLSTQGNFAHIKDRLGLNEVAETQVESPFDYSTSVLLCLPTDMPEPNQPDYQTCLQQSLINLCKASSGKIMVLFTSHSAVQSTRSGIKDTLEMEGFKVLAQGIDGTPANLQASFLENPNAILLGTSSFWQGVDIPGDALKVLVVARLPFNVPTDPIFSTRSSLLEDPFNQYAVPQSILRFRQGFGRLIRTESDKGVVAILDSRILSKTYGPAFIKSLPQCKLLKGSLLEIEDAVRRWMI